MSRFYIQVGESARKHQPTARGHWAVSTYCASWNGSVYTRVYLDDNNREKYEVWLKPWHGHGKHELLNEGYLDQQ